MLLAIFERTFPDAAAWFDTAHNAMSDVDIARNMRGLALANQLPVRFVPLSVLGDGWVDNDPEWVDYVGVTADETDA